MSYRGPDAQQLGEEGLFEHPFEIGHARGATGAALEADNALDRLQITIAPVIIGSGRPSIQLPEIVDLTGSLRPRTRRFDLGRDTLIECVFND